MSEKDPLLRLIQYFYAWEKRLPEYGKKLEDWFDAGLMNLYMIAYYYLGLMILLLFFSHLFIASERQDMVNLGALFHVGAGLTAMCHQLPYRSLIFDGVPMAVCSRDVGIYLGFLAGYSIVFWRERPRILSTMKAPLLASIPIALDGVTQTILALRESNNALRIITGFIFAFGVIAYLVEKLMLKKNEHLKGYFVSNSAVIAGLLTALFLVNASIYVLGQAIPMDYSVRGNLVDKAIKQSSLTGYSIRTYYVPSRAPLAAQADPFRDRYEDMILSDIQGMEWAENLMPCDNRTVQEPLRLTANMSVAEFLAQDAIERHRYGIWAVALLTEMEKSQGTPYLSGGSGEIHYFDALTGELIQKILH
jgi:uncharacterized membrane protein